MDCRSLLEVIPVTQLVSVVDGTKATFGEESRVAMCLPNCVLEKNVGVVRVVKGVGVGTAIEIRLEAK